ncbi:hypothetical protein BaRGS_00009385 [Batillaria attramentaria]|uniref:Secreted protein n=1 Tax=Batillaria attramentaria TaxID=370345 RepID=A0ABD0LJ35_9CAEN
MRRDDVQLSLLLADLWVWAKISTHHKLGTQVFMLEPSWQTSRVAGHSRLFSCGRFRNQTICISFTGISEVMPKRQNSSTRTSIA